MSARELPEAPEGMYFAIRPEGNEDIRVELRRTKRSWWSNGVWGYRLASPGSAVSCAEELAARYLSQLRRVNAAREFVAAYPAKRGRKEAA